MNAHDISINQVPFVIPTGLSQASIDALIEELVSQEPLMVDGGVNLFNSEIDTSKRKCKIAWLAPDHWISGMMAHFIHYANNVHFKAELTGWSGGVQYTVYGEEKSFYAWHTDDSPSSYSMGQMRKLSISLLLSDPDEYEGGELQLNRAGYLQTIKPEKGTAIIFPSSILHRVRPIKKGVRRSLVGWFEGPPWR